MPGKGPIVGIDKVNDRIEGRICGVVRDDSPSCPVDAFPAAGSKGIVEVRVTEGMGAASFETETGILAVVLKPRLSVTIAEIACVPLDTRGLAQWEVKTGPEAEYRSANVHASIWN